MNGGGAGGLPVHAASQQLGTDMGAAGTDISANAASRAKAATAAAASILGSLRQCWGNAGVLPASTTEGWICYVALLIFFPSTLIIRALGVSLHWRLVLIAAVPAAVVLSLEAVYLKVMGCDVVVVVWLVLGCVPNASCSSFCPMSSIVSRA